MRNHSIKRFTAIFWAVLLFMLLLAAPVFAEGEEGSDIGETPIEEPAQGEEIPAVEDPLPQAEEPLPVEEPSVEALDNAEEEAPPADAVEEPSPEPVEEVVAEEPLESTEPVEESTETDSLPESLADADLTLAGSDGETLDLASEATAQTVAGADPYFKVGTQYYRWLLTGGDCTPYLSAGDICTTSATPIQDAINYINTNGTIPTDRKIYVEAESYTESVTIDGANPNLSTLNGLIGVDGSSLTTITGNIYVHDLADGFTLSGFTVHGQVQFTFMGGTITLEDLEVHNPGGYGIQVHTNVNAHVVLDKVNASDNFGWGADIDNDDGGMPYNVTIKNSYFDDNDPGGNTEGLSIRSMGHILIDGVSASRNRGSGINIVSDFSSLTVKNAVLSNNAPNPVISGIGYGLRANSTTNAKVTLENIYALNAAGDIPAVVVTTAGSIQVKNAQVHNNAGGGMSLTNDIGTGYVKVYDSAFNNNGQHGLHIDSLGTVYLSSVSANDNGASGVYIDNCNASGTCTGSSTVTVTSLASAGAYGANSFNDNTYEGLYIISGKSISVTNVISDRNGYDGMYLNNDWGSGGISVKKNIPSTDYLVFNNSASNNGSEGIFASSNGTIRIEYLLANNNTAYGGNIRNETSTFAPGINILHSTFNENDQTGLYVYSNGTIALTNVSASKNNIGSSNGAYFNTLTGTSGGVSIKGIKGYTCQFNENGYYGIFIDVRGTVTLSNIEALNNGNTTYINNYDTAYAKKVSITNGKFSDQTFGYGLEIYSKGAISLNNVEANNNPRGGALLNNTYGFANVNVKNSEFNDNSSGTSWVSLDIYSMRNISLYAVSAIDGFTGARLDNCRWDGLICTGSGTVTIKSGKGVYNEFSEHGNQGLNIWASGTVSLSNIIVENNANTGVNIDNNETGVSGNVNISAGKNMRNVVSGGSSTGLYIYSNGTVSVKYLDAFRNKGDGLYIDNDSALSAKGVTVKESTFTANQGRGLYVRSLGTITLQGVDCSDNSRFDGNINILGQGYREVLSHTLGNDRWTFEASGTDDDYTINLKSVYFDAYLELYAADGQLLDSDDNGGTGTDAYLSGVDLPDGFYTIVVSSADGVGGGYYELTLNTSSFIASSWTGAYLDNGAGTGGVKILYSSKMGYGARFQDNTYTGLRILSQGAVSLNSVEANYNAGLGGVYISNNSLAETPVTIKTISVTGNNGIGLYVSSSGNISISKVESVYNELDGVHLINTSAAVNRNVKVTNAVFKDNRGGEGMEIQSKGNVTLSSVFSDNPDATFAVSIDNTSGTGNVTVTGKDNTFNNAGMQGLYIDSKGYISLANVSASNNGTDGIFARNAYPGFSNYIKVTNTQRGSFNFLYNNGDEGLYLNSYGTVTVNKVYADSNAAYTYINCSGAPEFKKVTVTNSIFSNTTGTGLNLSVYGAVYLNNVRLLDNTSQGLAIINNTAAEQDVVIKNTTVTGNGLRGVNITSAGFVIIDRMNASDNGGDGVTIQNMAGNEGVTISNSTFYNNIVNGLTIASDGPVAVKTVTAKQNLQYGIHIDGGSSDIAVTLYKVNTIYNTDTGMYVQGAGSVNVNLSNSIGNGSAGVDADGLYIHGNGTTPVTLNKSIFLGNYGNGVDLHSTAPPTITYTLIFGNDVDLDGQDELYEH